MIWRFLLQNLHVNGGAFTEVDEPQGWDACNFVLSRSDIYHGVIEEYTIGLNFRGTGFNFLYSVYQGQTADAEVQIHIYLYCGTGFKPVYQGKMNLINISFNVSQDKGCFATCNIEQSGEIIKLMNRTDQPVNIFSLATLDKSKAMNLPPKAKYELNYHSKKIRKRTVVEKLAGNFYQDESQVDGVPALSVSHTNDEAVWANIGWDTPALQELGWNGLTNDIGSYSGPGFRVQIPMFIAPETGLYAINFCFHFTAKLRLETNATLDSTGEGHGGSFDTMRLRFIVSYPILSTLLFDVIQTGAIFDPVGNFWVALFSGTITYSANVFLGIADKFYAFFRTDSHGIYTNYGISDADIKIHNDFQISNVCCFDINLDSTAEPSKGFVALAHECFGQIIQSITDKELGFKSNYLGRKDIKPILSDKSALIPSAYNANGCAGFTALTNGLLIRGFVKKPDQLTYSCGVAIGDPLPAGEELFVGLRFKFEELWREMNNIWSLGMGFEKQSDNSYVARIENKGYFYDNTVQILLIDGLPGLDNDYKIQPYTTAFYSLIDGGFDVWQVEEVNGRDEFNSPRNYTTKLKSNKERLDIRNRWIGSGYCIETTRRQLVTTKDWRYDENIFIVCVKQTVDISGFPIELDKTEQAAAFDVYFIGHPRRDPSGGLYDKDTSYNLRIAPQRNLQRWLPIVLTPSGIMQQVGYQGNDNEKMQLQSVPGDTICCSRDYASILYPTSYGVDGVLSCDKPFYKPEILSFTYPLSFQDYNNLKANPNGLIKIVQSGIANGFWWLKKITYNPAQGNANFELLRSARALVHPFIPGCTPNQADVENTDEYQNWKSRCTVPPSILVEQNMCWLIQWLKFEGIWDKIDCLYILAVHDRQAATLNIKGSSHQLTEQSWGAESSFIPLQGYHRTNYGGYYNTNYNAYTQGVKFKTQDASYMLFSNSAPYIYGSGGAAANSPSTHLTIAFYQDSTTYVELNEEYNGIPCDAYSIFPLGSSYKISVRNSIGKEESSACTNSSVETGYCTLGIPDADIYLSAINWYGGPIQSFVGYDDLWGAMFGGYLTQDERCTLYKILRCYYMNINPAYFSDLMPAP